MARTFALAIVSALVVGALAAAASPAAVTVGSDLATEPNGQTSCSSSNADFGCLAVQDKLPGRSVVAPADGVVVRWRLRVGGDTQAQTIRINVVRRVDATRFKLVTVGPVENLPEGAGTYTFPAAIPIGAGDQLGLEGGKGTGIEWRAELPGAGYLEYGSNPFEADGITEAPVFGDEGEEEEVTFNFDVEPDCDRDGLGDETQDTVLPPPCKANAITLGKPKLVKKRGIALVPVSVPGPGTLLLGGAGVAPSSTTVSAAGTVSLRVKASGPKKKRLRKTGKAKLTLSVTFTPTGGVANTQPKTVTLRKRLPLRLRPGS